MLHPFLLSSYALRNFPYNLVVVTVSKQQDPEIAEISFQVMVMGPWFFPAKVTAVYVHTRVHDVGHVTSLAVPTRREKLLNGF